MREDDDVRLGTVPVRLAASAVKPPRRSAVFTIPPRPTMYVADLGGAAPHVWHAR